MEKKKNPLIMLISTFVIAGVLLFLLGPKSMVKVDDTAEDDGRIYGAVKETMPAQVQPDLPEPGTLEASLAYLWNSETGPETYYFAKSVPEEARQAVQKETEKIRSQGFEVGFVVHDFKTGDTMTYNANSRFYPASTIKAHYAISLVDGMPELLEPLYLTFADLLINSSNEAYQYFADYYGFEYLRQWCLNAGVEPRIADNMYINMTTMDSARLWAENYYWFEEHPDSPLNELYETPWKSIIVPVLDENTVSRTKAGWYDGDPDAGENQSGDGGIIYAGDHPFELVVYTTFEDDFESVEPLVKALIDAHEAMVNNH